MTFGVTHIRDLKKRKILTTDEKIQKIHKTIDKMRNDVKETATMHKVCYEDCIKLENHLRDIKALIDKRK